MLLIPALEQSAEIINTYIVFIHIHIYMCIYAYAFLYGLS